MYKWELGTMISPDAWNNGFNRISENHLYLYSEYPPRTGGVTTSQSL